MVGLHTGMRHQEILAIRRHDVDPKKRIIWVPQAKAGSREQPITRELAQYLEDRMKMLPGGCEWLFPSPASAEGHILDEMKRQIDAGHTANSAGTILSKKGVGKSAGANAKLWGRHRKKV